ncbi:hypothetical protein WJX77_001798 [Trebouxia sp. C0004]
MALDRAHDLVNQHRVTAGRQALVLENALTACAQRHSQDMAHMGRMGHTGANGSNLQRRLSEAGWTTNMFAGAAENVAEGQSSPEEVVQGWLNSPGHATNIYGDYTHTGLGFVARTKKHREYWTQVFVKAREQPATAMLPGGGQRRRVSPVLQTEGVWQFAERHVVDFDTVMAINGFAKGSQPVLQPGQLLWLP